MAKRIDIKNFTEKDGAELLYHMSVQSLLDMKALLGEVSMKTIMDTKQYSSESKTILFGGHVAYSVFTVPSESKEQTNMFLYATTEGYSKMNMMKESLFSVINDLQKNKICSIVYKGNKKLQSILRANGFHFEKNMCFGVEKRNFCLFVRD